MSKELDPALYESNYERTEGDRYWTEPWVTRALMETYLDDRIGSGVWEPAVGRGDIQRELEKHYYRVFGSDIDISESPEGSVEIDFFTGPIPELYPLTGGIVSNPPYNLAQEFIEKALEYSEKLDLPVVAMLLRSEFKHAKSRAHLFGPGSGYACEVVLTTRPRWDWWFRDTPKASPRHNFSWFIWDSQWEKEPIQRFCNKADVE